jgi:hypothetical protein
MSDSGERGNEFEIKRQKLTRTNYSPRASQAAGMAAGVSS